MLGGKERKKTSLSKKRTDRTDVMSSAVDKNGNVTPGAKAAAAEASIQAAREASRVKQGHLECLARLVLFSPVIPDGETSHWSVVSVGDLKWLPPGLNEHTRLTDYDRTKLQTFLYTGGHVEKWNSYVFARVENSECITSVLH